MSACSGPSDASSEKYFVKSEEAQNNDRIDWFVTVGFLHIGPGCLWISDDSRVFFKSYSLSDFKVRVDTVFVSIYVTTYKLDSSKLGSYVLVLDTTGHIWNNAESRLARLRQKNLDISKPHFNDSWCEKGHCQ